jgi:nitrous oxide reductase accessory protein NosL
MSLLKILFIFIIFNAYLFAYPNYSTAIKEKKLYPMGGKIYKKKCSPISLDKYSSYDELEKDVTKNNLCGKLSKKYSDALFLYLWEVKKGGNSKKHYEKLTVTKKDKCPICGMFLYKYPKWVSRIEYKDKNESFDGIKDMMKYYFKYPNNIKNILVQEYYTGRTINARKAYFVIGSAVYGPMGNELIAFKDEASARRFSLDHKGKKIVTFKEITQNEVYKLDD